MDNSKTIISEETRAQALQMAKATQKPQQTKAQTKLITQGIEKGIAQYKKQQKALARERNRQLKKDRAARALAQLEDIEDPLPEATTQGWQIWLPWGLLALSWLGFGGYLLLR